MKKRRGFGGVGVGALKGGEEGGGRRAEGGVEERAALLDSLAMEKQSLASRALSMRESFMREAV